MKRHQLHEILEFLNSIEGAGYGGMASFEIARDYVYNAFQEAFKPDGDEDKISRLESDKETLATGWESDLP